METGGIFYLICCAYLMKFFPVFLVHFFSTEYSEVYDIVGDVMFVIC